MSAGIWNNGHGLSGYLELALHLEPQGAGTPAGAGIARGQQPYWEPTRTFPRSGGAGLTGNTWLMTTSAPTAAGEASSPSSGISAAPPPHPSRNLAQLKGLSLPPAGDIASWKVTVLQPRPLSRTSLPPGRQGTETHRGSGRGHPLPRCGAGLGPGATGETDSHPHLSFPLPGELEVNPSCLGLSAGPGFSPDSPGGAGVRARLWSPGGGCPRIWISYKVPEGRRLGWRPCAEGRCVSPGGPGSPSPPGGAHRLDGGRDPHLPWHVRIWERARLLLWG